MRRLLHQCIWRSALQCHRQLGAARHAVVHFGRRNHLARKNCQRSGSSGRGYRWLDKGRPWHGDNLRLLLFCRNQWLQFRRYHHHRPDHDPSDEGAGIPDKLCRLARRVWRHSGRYCTAQSHFHRLWHRHQHVDRRPLSWWNFTRPAARNGNVRSELLCLQIHLVGGSGARAVFFAPSRFGALGREVWPWRARHHLRRNL